MEDEKKGRREDLDILGIDYKKKEKKERRREDLDILGDDRGMLCALHVVKPDRFAPAIGPLLDITWKRKCNFCSS